jgi:hypothetical protein
MPNLTILPIYSMVLMLLILHNNKMLLVNNKFNNPNKRIQYY